MGNQEVPGQVVYLCSWAFDLFQKRKKKEKRKRREEREKRRERREEREERGERRRESHHSHHPNRDVAKEALFSGMLCFLLTAFYPSWEYCYA